MFHKPSQNSWVVSQKIVIYNLKKCDSTNPLFLFFLILWLFHFSLCDWQIREENRNFLFLEFPWNNCSTFSSKPVSEPFWAHVGVVSLLRFSAFYLSGQQIIADVFSKIMCRFTWWASLLFDLPGFWGTTQNIPQICRFLSFFFFCCVDSGSVSCLVTLLFSLS